MPPHKVKLIVNPNANLGRAWMAARDLRPTVEEFGGADWAGTVYPTHATELARQAGEMGYELVIAAGGDGTTHEVLNGLMQVPKERRPRLGVIPLGSGNDFAHAIGLPPEPLPALRQIFNGKPHPIDIVRLHDSLDRTEYWGNTLGIGFDTTVTLRSRNFRMFSGFLIYFLAVVQTILLNYDAARMQIETDQGSFDEHMLMLVLCNGGREGGGFNVAPQARPDDGVLDYAGVLQTSRLRMFRLLPEVMKGTHAGFKEIRMGRFRRLSLQADRPLYIHLDGEIFAGWGMDVRRLEVELLAGEIEVIS
jgi:diacylglycerol kinase (ATP)